MLDPEQQELYKANVDAWKTAALVNANSTEVKKDIEEAARRFLAPIVSIDQWDGQLDLQGLQIRDVPAIDDYLKPLGARVLDLSGTAIERLDFACDNHIEALSVTDCSQLKTLNIRHCIKLRNLYLKNSAIEHLTLPDECAFTKWSSDECPMPPSLPLNDGRRLAELEIKNHALESLDLRGSGIKELIITECTELKTLTLSNSSVETLSIADSPNLVKLDIFD